MWQHLWDKNPDDVVFDPTDEIGAPVTLEGGSDVVV